MKKGIYRHKIKIQYPIETRDAVGQVVPSWALLCECRAAIEPLTYRELAGANQLITDATFRVRLRRRPESEPRVAGKMRILYGEREFEIISHDNDLAERGREVHLLCREVF